MRLYFSNHFQHGCFTRACCTAVSRPLVSSARAFATPSVRRSDRIVHSLLCVDINRDASEEGLKPGLNSSSCIIKLVMTFVL